MRKLFYILLILAFCSPCFATGNLDNPRSEEPSGYTRNADGTLSLGTGTSKVTIGTDGSASTEGTGTNGGSITMPQNSYSNTYDFGSKHGLTVIDDYLYVVTKAQTKENILMNLLAPVMALTPTFSITTTWNGQTSKPATIAPATDWNSNAISSALTLTNAITPTSVSFSGNLPTSLVNNCRIYRDSDYANIWTYPALKNAYAKSASDLRENVMPPLSANVSDISRTSYWPFKQFGFRTYTVAGVDYTASLLPIQFLPSGKITETYYTSRTGWLEDFDYPDYSYTSNPDPATIQALTRTGAIPDYASFVRYNSVALTPTNLVKTGSRTYIPIVTGSTNVEYLIMGGKALGDESILLDKSKTKTVIEFIAKFLPLPSSGTAVSGVRLAAQYVTTDQITIGLSNAATDRTKLAIVIRNNSVLSTDTITTISPADDFHKYTIIISGTTYDIYVDDVLVQDETTHAIKDPSTWTQFNIRILAQSTAGNWTGLYLDKIFIHQE